MNPRRHPTYRFICVTSLAACALSGCQLDDRVVGQIEGKLEPDAGADAGGSLGDSAAAAAATAGQGGGTGDVREPGAGGRLPLAGDGGQPTSPDERDVVPPRLVSVTPVEGSTQVTSELVTLEFDEPMDRSSVEAAFAGGTSFSWAADDTTVTFRFPMPFAAEPRLFDLVVPASVRDRAGNELGLELETSIVLAGLARVSLPLDGALSGNQVAGSDGSFTFFEAGDTAGGLVRYGAASFPLAELPALGAIIALRSATLHVQVTDVEGNPSDPAFDGFVIDRVALRARADIDAPEILEPAFARLLVPPDVAPGRVVRLDVAAQLVAAWSAGDSHVQFRVGPPASNLDAVTDTVFLRRNADENDSVVDLTALPEPDPENAARIEVEYFP